jgi:hypothetical protein
MDMDLPERCDECNGLMADVGCKQIIGDWRTGKVAWVCAACLPALEAFFAAQGYTSTRLPHLDEGAVMASRYDRRRVKAARRAQRGKP